MNRGAMACVLFLALAGSARGLQARVLAEPNAYYDSTRIKSRNTPSAMVVTRGGEVLLERYEAGSYKDFSVSVDANAMFVISSATQSYAAAFLINLQKAGILSLDDSAARFLPAFRTRGEGLFDRREVQVRHYCFAHIRIIYSQREI